ncbi:MAG: hypothetical protein AMJ53_07190 [Gammaproteobacteria bacterium SG8_11]|nr:MAG: hypothetical protein AMJ53_07190 [Gammaproteobacteria bacterium SG8_11]
MQTLLLLLSIQGLIGAYDSIYHHDFKEKLSLKPIAKNELKIHSIRSLLYSILFLSFGWTQWQGWLAPLFAAILVIELLLTLWDFVEEDRSRVLPASERITHTILTLNFGAILALFMPELLRWQSLPTDLSLVDHGIYSWIMTVYGVGVIPFAIREYISFRRLGRKPKKISDNKNSYPSMPPQNILITGGTGFIGQSLCNALLSQGHTLTLLVRDYVKAATLFGSSSRLTFISSIDQLKDTDRFDTVINLAGEPIATGRWNQRKKQLIKESRFDTTKQIVHYIKTTHTKPKLFISGSAIGYYGPREDEVITESSPGTPCFSNELCAQWEALAQQVQYFGVRVCLLRTGIVLGKTGGVLASMLIPFSYGLGGKLGDGRQWMSWIHIEDVVGIILELIRNEYISGPINATAPNPVNNAEFTRVLGKHLYRPTVLKMPGFVLRMVMGEVADELLLVGLKAIPKKITDNGYQFLYPHLSDALVNIIGPG